LPSNQDQKRVLVHILQYSLTVAFDPVDAHPSHLLPEYLPPFSN
jgi:hypothetical protein